MSSDQVGALAYVKIVPKFDINYLHIFNFFKYAYWFYRKRKGRERERNIDVIGCLPYVPQPGIEPAT